MADQLLDTHKLIVGTSGAGKTTTARAELEQLLDQRRHLVVIDPMDVYWGERSDAAGTGPGYDIPIFGGRHGDVALTAADGAAIARIIAEQRISAIVSIKHLQDDFAQRAFVLAFLRELRLKPQGNFHLVIDEAEEFCPQTPPDDVAFELTRLISWFTKRGRSEGFVLTLITQRPADISKAVVSLCETIVAHRLVSPLDQDAIERYLKRFADRAVRDEVMKSLAGLKTGERWIYSPAADILERGVTPPIATFDSSRTPAAGEILAEPKLLSQVDMTAIAALLSRPSAVPKDPRQAFEAGTEAGLAIMDRDRRIAELEEKLGEVCRVNDALTEHNEQLIDDGVACIDAIVRATEILKDALVGVSTGKAAVAISAMNDVLADADPHAARVANLHSHDAETAQSLATAKRGEAARDAPRAASRRPAGSAELNAAALALAGLLKAMPGQEAPWTHLLIFGGFRPGSGWIRKSQNQLSEQGYIDIVGDRAIATDKLKQSAIDALAVPSPAAVRALWTEKLRGPGGAIAAWLAEHGPATRAEIGAGISMSSTAGWFRKGIKDAVGSNLMRETGDGRLVAHQLLTGARR
ncbi:hypothetical protein O4H52_08070 [Sphingomonadaceae bacterium G21617-S1]|nr:hypothetical protein [Sphingomonadaceae bacterium G21617-S1]